MNAIENDSDVLLIFSSPSDDVETFVIGADYTTGPFKFGASYYHQDDQDVAGDLETDRITGGVRDPARSGL